MSAFANQSAAAPAPVAPQVKPAPPQVAPHPPGRKKWLVLLLLIAVVAAGAYLLRPRAQQTTATQAVIKTFRVTAGPLSRTVRVAGTTSARNFANIAGPMMRGREGSGTLTLIYLAKSGAMVKKGEVIAQIDAQTMKDHVDDLTATITQAEADVRKRQADQAIEIENLNQNLRLAKATLDKAKLDYGAQEIRTTIDQELLKLAVEESEARHRELQEEIKIASVSNTAEIRILELTRDRHVRHRDRHKLDIEKFTMNAPMSGLAVFQTIWRGGEMGQVQVGDQVAPGQPFMKIVDPASMQLEATINQVDSEEVRLAQPVSVSFDAFPGLYAKGKVRSIGALAVGGWRQSYFIRSVPVVIQLLSSDSRLIPDLSAGGDILLGQEDNGLPVPLDAVQTENGKSVVYVKQGDQFTPREVKLGLESNTQVAVLAGLSAGDEIALQRPGTATH
jgi:multidrug efflux pump subunit AcrA (membrane-fusion protein)